MKKYSDKYRVICEFDEEDNHLKKLNGHKDLDNAFIYCKNGNITISRHDDKSVRIDLWQSITEKIVKEMKRKKVNIIMYENLDGEGYIIADEKDIHKIARICNAKRQRKHPVPIGSKSHNLSYWKRHCKRVK